MNELTNDSVKLKRQKYYQENKEKILARSKQYYQENKEKIINKQKQYNKNNKEYSKQYYQDNKEEIIKQVKLYQKLNRAKCRETARKLRRKNLTKIIKDHGSCPDAPICYVTVKTAEINKHLAELLVKKEEFKKKLLEEQNK